MIELVEAQNLLPGDVIHEGTLPWTVGQVRFLEWDVVSVTTNCGTKLDHLFTTRGSIVFRVERWESRVRSAKRDLVMRIMGVYSPPA